MIVWQILLVSALVNVQRTVWRIWKLMLKCKGLIILLTVCHIIIMLVWRILLVMFSQQGGAQSRRLWRPWYLRIQASKKEKMIWRVFHPGVVDWKIYFTQNLKKGQLKEKIMKTCATWSTNNHEGCCLFWGSTQLRSHCGCDLNVEEQTLLRSISLEWGW